jgi:hypothetical protein
MTKDNKTLSNAVSEALNSIHGFRYGMKIPLVHNVENDTWEVGEIITSNNGFIDETNIYYVKSWSIYNNDISHIRDMENDDDRLETREDNQDVYDNDINMWGYEQDFIDNEIDTFFDEEVERIELEVREEQKEREEEENE